MGSQGPNVSSDRKLRLCSDCVDVQTDLNLCCNLTQIIYWYFFTIFHFDHFDIFFYQKFVHLGENNSRYCSQSFPAELSTHVSATTHSCIGYKVSVNLIVFLWN